MAKVVGGTRNEKLVRRYDRIAGQVTELEPRIHELSPDGLRELTDELRVRTGRILKPLNDWWASLTPNDRFDHFNVRRYRKRHDQVFRELCDEGVLPEAFAVLREASRRAQNHRHFDCQLVGGLALYLSKVAEMKTGEGKTIVCHLPAFMKILEGKKVFVVTVNDYLVQRDAEFARPIFELLGLTVGYIQSQVDPGGREGVRQQAYACDITYGTNNEFGFDYLRDNMKTRREAQVQGSLDFAIIDEVDSILIDEARTPLIISGPSDDDVSRYPEADAYARHLIDLQTQANRETQRRIAEWGDTPPDEWRQREKFDDALQRFKADPDQRMIGLTDDEAEAIGHQQYFVVQRDRKQVGLTQDGAQAAQDRAGKGSFYHGDNLEWPHLIENALRAHVVYVRDKDYVVQNGEVIIVDEFTGRLMIGRQWSDGLHQAIEAKERVQVKQESQTLATITIQNFFKLFQHLAGMTGTAMTEVEEFEKIYRLDCMAVPTNRAVNRDDHNDKIYRTGPDKSKAIVDEINQVHRRGRPGDPFVLADVLKALRPIRERAGEDVAKIDQALAAFDKAEEGDPKTIEEMLAAYDDAMGDLSIGRPVLVGTTSVEKSELLSNLLDREYGIEHEVLNAKNHAREAEIVAKAGHRHPPTRGKDKTPRGNVTIATNMAGRGTDIKLEPGVVYEKCVGDLGPGDESLAKKPLTWSEPGVTGTKCCIQCADYDASTNCAHCWKPKVDPRFPALGRTVCALSSPCGLHIVGTERHESRRIDNQLRGRAGRQGDPGSSRFFLSLEDDLMKLFMPERMIKLMEWLGLTGGASIEHKRVSKSIEGAQKKVEERNFSTRKHLLEWDEPMDYQRKAFYAERQQILEGRGLDAIIWRMIDQVCDQAVKRFLSPGYGRQCIVIWCRHELDLDVTPAEVDGDELEYIEAVIREKSISEITEEVTNSIGEYVDEELPASEWDLNGLLTWARRRFGLKASQNQLARMDPDTLEEFLIDAARKHYEQVDLSAIQPYLDPSHGRRSFVEWVRVKFGIDMDVDKIVDRPAADVLDELLEQARAVNRRREIEFPVDQILAFAFREGGDNPYAAERIVGWANHKFACGWTIDHLKDKSVDQVRTELINLNTDFLTKGRLESQIDEHLARLAENTDEMVAWANRRFDGFLDPAALQSSNGTEPIREVLLNAGRVLLRFELTSLEQTILLQIYDQAWKDHLRDMDHKKEEVMQRTITDKQEQHPQSRFAQEGGELFAAMLDTIQERVTDLIFKVRIGRDDDEEGAGSGAGTGGGSKSPFDNMQLSHAEATGGGFTGVNADREAAMKAQGDGRKVTETIRRDEPKVGRNDPCPCGSGKKYKQCHGKKGG
jgi:preprotein translocase subunit SecA